MAIYLQPNCTDHCQDQVLWQVMKFV